MSINTNQQKPSILQVADDFSDMIMRPPGMFVEDENGGMGMESGIFLSIPGLKKIPPL
jgi:hypothetical protein